MQRLLRSALYMPGANQRAMDKARELAADAVIFDLEDAVAPDMKETARNQVLASAGAIPFLAPVMLGLLPYLVEIDTPGSTRASSLGAGLFLAYLVVLVALVLLNIRRARASRET